MTTGPILLVVAALVVSRAAEAAGLPDWLLGDWVITKVYQKSDYGPDELPPSVRLGGKIMTAEPDRLHLGVDICTDLTVRQKRDTIGHLVPGHKPEKLGLIPRPDWLPYLEIHCGRSLTEEKDGLDDRHINYINWIIIPNGRNKIDLIFLYSCYLELRRKEKPFS